MSSLFRVLATSIVAFLPLVLAAAEIQQPGSGAASGPKVQSASQEVTLDLVVRDKHGRSVVDLRPEELLITDDGKPGKLKSLQLVSGVTDEIRLVSFVMDSADSDSVRPMRMAIAEMLKSASGPNTYFSVWKVGAHPQLLQPYTQDREAILHVVGAGPAPTGVAVPPPKSQANATQAKLTGLENDALAAAERLIREQHERPWVAGLIGLSKEQARIPGRKEIVFFAAQPRVAVTPQQQVEAIVSNANRAGVSIYAVDMGGVSAQAAANAAGMAGVSGSMGQGWVVKSSEPNEADRPSRGTDLDGLPNASSIDRQNMVREIAERTGGLYANGTGDVREPMRRAAADLDTYYEVTYLPEDEQYDGHFCRVSIAVDRPHVKVQSRAGHFSVPASGGLDLAAFEIPLVKALDAGKPETWLPFSVEAFRFGREQGGTRTAIAVQVPLGLVNERDDQAERVLKMHFSIVALLRTPDGKIADKISQDVPYEAPEERKKEIQAGTYTLEKSLVLPPGEYRMDVAVSDENANEISSKSLPLRISNEQSGLGLADVTLIKSLDAAAGGMEADDPFRYGAQKVVPEVKSTVKAKPDAVLPVFLTIYPNAAIASPVNLELEVLRGASVVGTFPMTSEGKDRTEPRSFLVSIPEKSLSAGHYTLIATATQGSETTERRREFDLEMAGPAAAAESTYTAPADAVDTPLLTISPMPKLQSGAESLDAARLKSLIDGTRRRAIDYQTVLPNFVCIETTKRFIDKTGRENWKQKDAITELIRFVSGKEERNTLEVNGVRDHTDRAHLGGLQTSGLFGELLDAVFSEHAQADFKWQGHAELEGSTVGVLQYSVARAHSEYSLTTEDGLHTMVAGFHGQVYVDPNTYGVKYVSIQADGLPPDFLYRESVITVSYDYVTVGGENYLLPISATLSVRHGKRLLLRNEMQFRQYRRYMATSRFIVK